MKSGLYRLQRRADRLGLYIERSKPCAYSLRDEDGNLYPYALGRDGDRPEFGCYTLAEVDATLRQLAAA